MLRNLIEGMMFFRDGEKTFFEPKLFPWTADLEAGWKAIRRELDAVMARREEIPNFQDVSKAQEALTEGDQWKTFFLYTFDGKKVKDNCARCPETVRLLDRVPGRRQAMFSILAPKKHIPEHRGPYKGLLRYHLGLMVPGPEGSSRIRVGRDIQAWREGKSMIFDDSHPHEVWNGDFYRVVLFMDFVRPLLFPLSLVNQSIIWMRGLRPL
jgi:beta-hydroxylase